MPRSRISLETGMHSPRVSQLLSELAHEVIVAHARNVRLIRASRRKDNRLDAQTLARLAACRTGCERATALVNTARGLAKSYGEWLRGCNPRNLNPEKPEGLSPELQAALQPLLAGVEVLSGQIRESNERIEAPAGIIARFAGKQSQA
jgi:transposase